MHYNLKGFVFLFQREMKRTLLATLLCAILVHGSGADSTSKENVYSCANATRSMMVSFKETSDINTAIAQFCVDECIQPVNCNKKNTQVKRLQISLIYCKHVLLYPLEECKCEKSRSQVCDLMQGKSFRPKNLGEFCRAFGISDEECKCDKKNDVHRICSFKRSLEGKSVLIRDKNYDYAIAAVTTFALLVALVGNSLVLLVSFRHRSQLSTSKILVGLLAMADTVSSILNFTHTVYFFWRDTWPLGVPLCKIVFTGEFDYLSSERIVIGFLVIKVPGLEGLLPMNEWRKGKITHLWFLPGRSFRWPLSQAASKWTCISIIEYIWK